MNKKLFHSSTLIAGALVLILSVGYFLDLRSSLGCLNRTRGTDPDPSCLPLDRFGRLYRQDPIDAVALPSGVAQQGFRLAALAWP